MLKPERQSRILKEINIHNKVFSSDLSLLLTVSEDTIRRDLNELAENDKILKVHGGAMSKSFHSVIAKTDFYAEVEKNIIATKVLSLIHDGMCVLTSSGTTIRTIVKLLPLDLKATFFTISPMTAIELNEHPTIEVILLGGKIAKEAQISTGGKVVEELSQISVDLCLLGTNGIDAEFGITDSEYEIVQVKKAMRKASEKLAIVTISEKLNTKKKMKVFDLEDIDYLITELDADNPCFERYNKTGLTIL